jgi:hypothetical protein
MEEDVGDDELLDRVFLSLKKKEVSCGRCRGFDFWSSVWGRCTSAAASSLRGVESTIGCDNSRLISQVVGL